MKTYKILLCLLVLIFVSGCEDSLNDDLEKTIQTQEDRDSTEPENPSQEDRDCIEPENPYDEGTGHYAGYEWAVENGENCNGNSESFNEGCSEYYDQLDEYEECMSDEK